MGILDRILRAGEGKKIKALAGLVPDINAIEAEMKALTDDQLQAKTPEFRQRLENGEELDDLPPGGWNVQVTTADGRSWQGEAATAPGAPATVAFR